MANIQSLTQSYLDDLRGARSENTYLTYRQALRAFLRIVGHDAPLDTGTYETFLKRCKGLNPSTAGILRTAVKGLYAFAAEHDPSINLAAMAQLNKRLTKKQHKDIPNPDRASIEKVLTHCETMRNGLQELRDRAFILVLADTGLRISEACALNRGTIDWQEGKAIIRGKGDKPAVIRFSNRALGALRDYLSARAQLDGSSGKPLASLPLFARHDKGAGKKVKRVGSGGMWSAVKERMKEAGIDHTKVRIHDFRHYFVTIAYLATGNIKIVQELARHEDIATTNRYAHLGGEADKAYDEIFNH